MDFVAPSVDFLILADHAEAINGKLYLMGGGWDRLWVADFGQPHRLAIAVGVLVPWNATNRQHDLALLLEGEDGQPLLRINVPILMGRPPALRPGDTQRMVLAINGPVALPGPGTYAVRALLNGEEDRRATFHAEAAPQSPPAPGVPPA
jgi:hypothetical protein